MMKNSIPVVLVFILFVASCANTIRGWSSHRQPGSDEITFKYLEGKAADTIHLKKGDQLQLAYTAENNTGNLYLAVALRGNTIWHQAISGTADTSVILPIDQDGTYKILTIGRQASGDFSLNYKRVRNKQIQVITNKNIELFGLMLQLDNGIDMINSKDSVTIYGKRVTMSEWYQKTCANYRRYQQFDSCAMMKLWRGYQAKGFYNDFFIGFLLETGQVPDARITANTDLDLVLAFSPKGDPEEGKRNATAFLNAMNDFYRQVNFGTYLKENEIYYRQAIINVKKNLPSGSLVSVMESFYRKSFNGYYLVPSLNIPSGMGFGKLHRKEKDIYNTFGPFTLQKFDPKDPQVGYDKPEYIRNLSVHEFGHSFVNPAIDKVPDTLIKSSAYLFQPIKETMTRLSYPGWRICLYESFVRAGEVIIARKLGDTSTANRIMKENVASGFIYLPEIVTELEKYDSDRSTHTSYDDFVPLVLQKLKVAHPKP